VREELTSLSAVILQHETLSQTNQEGKLIIQVCPTRDETRKQCGFSRNSTVDDRLKNLLAVLQ
jgi:hypothetical protein